MMLVPDRYELAWAAGFYDGEGCTGLKDNNGKHKYLIVTIGQHHPLVLERFQIAVLGVGSIHGPSKRGSWQYRASGYGAQAVLAMIWPYLGEVKKAQAITKMRAFKYDLQYNRIRKHSRRRVSNLARV